MLGLSLLFLALFAVAIIVAAIWSHALENPVFGRRLMRVLDFAKGAGLIAVLSMLVLAPRGAGSAAVTELHATIFAVATLAVGVCCAVTWALRPVWQEWRSVLAVLNVLVIAVAAGVWIGTTDWNGAAAGAIAGTAVWPLLASVWLAELTARMFSPPRATAYERLSALIRAGDARSRGRG